MEVVLNCYKHLSQILWLKMNWQKLAFHASTVRLGCDGDIRTTVEIVTRESDFQETRLRKDTVVMPKNRVA